MVTCDKAEVVVIGAGPAGLTAALYLARYRRNVLVLHDGASRALRIPKTHNVPGFPDGVEGHELIARMTRHAVEFGAVVEEAKVAALEQTDGGFAVECEDGRFYRTRAIILATGVMLNEVDLSREQHEAAIRSGVLRYCPICDGYEHTGNRVGVIGCDNNGAAEALFLRQYSSDITLMPLQNSELSVAQHRELDDAGIIVASGSLLALEPHQDKIDVRLEGGDNALSFDVLYPALGVQPRAELASALGISLTRAGCVPAQAISDSGIAGFFAAGDVVEGLDQISVVIGHGAMAATKAHNWLRERDQHTLNSAHSDSTSI